MLIGETCVTPSLYSSLFGCLIAVIRLVEYFLSSSNLGISHPKNEGCKVAKTLYLYITCTYISHREITNSKCPNFGQVQLWFKVNAVTGHVDICRTQLEV